MKAKDMVGEVCGKLTVTDFSHKTANGTSYWKCTCECGNTTIKSVKSLTRTSGEKSCGCTKGLGKTRSYRAWSAMHSRCENPSDARYKYYGARGISVCSEWGNYFSFLTDMGDPGIGLSLDRIDNDKGYDRSNCRWATKVQQARNTRAVNLITFDGETKCISEWAEYFDISYTQFRNWFKELGEDSIRLAKGLQSIGLTTKRSPSVGYLTIQVRYPVNAEVTAS